MCLMGLGPFSTLCHPMKLMHGQYSSILLNTLLIAPNGFYDPDDAIDNLLGIIKDDVKNVGSKSQPLGGRLL